MQDAELLAASITGESIKPSRCSEAVEADFREEERGRGCHALIFVVQSAAGIFCTAPAFDTYSMASTQALGPEAL